MKDLRGGPAPQAITLMRALEIVEPQVAIEVAVMGATAT